MHNGPESPPHERPEYRFKALLHPLTGAAEGES